MFKNQEDITGSLIITIRILLFRSGPINKVKTFAYNFLVLITLNTQFFYCIFFYKYLNLPWGDVPKKLVLLAERSSKANGAFPKSITFL